MATKKDDRHYSIYSVSSKIEWSLGLLTGKILFNYMLVWVSFLYTWRSKVLTDFFFTITFRNGKSSCSFISFIKLIWLCIPLRWSRNYITVSCPWNDNKVIIHTLEPTLGIWSCRFQGFLIFVCRGQRYRSTHLWSFCLFVKLSPQNKERGFNTKSC